MHTLSFALAHLVQKLLAKNSLALRSRHFDLFTPVTSFLTWPKNGLIKNCRACPSVSNAVYRLSLACFVFEISGVGRLSAPPVGTKVARTPVCARVKFVFSLTDENAK